MRIQHSSRPPAGPRRGQALRLLAATAAALGAAACSGDELVDPPFADVVRPTVSLARGNVVADSVLAVNVNARDDIGLKRIRVSLEGGVTAAFDTTFTSAVDRFVLDLRFFVPRSAPLGATVTATAVVSDGAGNQSDTARTLLTVGNLTPPRVAITSPSAGSPVVVGKALVIGVSAAARFKVRAVGYEVRGAFAAADSAVYASPLRDSLAWQDTLTVPDTVRGQSVAITPFIVDSLNQRVAGTPVVFAVQRADNTNSIPVVRTGVAPRLETTDTVFVEATDPVGIATLGYEVRSLTGTLIAADSVASTGSFSTLVRTFTVRLPLSVSTAAVPVVVTGFARNVNGRRDVARLPGGGARLDTVAVVAGFTRTLPDGGRVADALYVPRKDRLYLTNIERNQVEVYNLADSTFRAPIVVGSRPWGIAAWPRNRDGEMADSLIVANSGGTNLSYVDLNRGTTGREVYRYALPNIIAYSVTTVRAQQSDQLITQRTVYDFSDRPQYLGTTCTGASAPGAPCEDIVAVYSTTPTPGQSTPFANQGTVRWENLTKRMSHFFFEQAQGQTEGRADTLEIERYAANGEGSDSVLVPFRQQVPRGDGTTFPYSIVVRLDRLAFRDTTFVRNSGDFRRVVVGEGGPVLGSRAMTFDVTSGFELLPPRPVIDRGVSRPIDVSDIVANAFARVQGVGINFDGALAAIKGDSTYLFDGTLRLQGILQARGGAGGLDFHPFNRGANSSPLNTRLAFVASSEPVIDIFDTWCYRRVASVPIRDPIIGPVRASIRPNGQIVLVGATARGVTLVALPDTFTTTCL
jgi:hypothetical protein